MKFWIILFCLSLFGGCLFAQHDVPIRLGDIIDFSGTTVSCPDGGMILVWEDTTLGDLDIMAQKLDPSGNPVWDNPVCLCRKQGMQVQPKIISTNDGAYFVAWIDLLEPTSKATIGVQLLNDSGQTFWGEQGLTMFGTNISATDLFLLPNEVGGAFVYCRDASPEQRILMQKVNAQGNGLLPSTGMLLFSFNGVISLQNVMTDWEGGAILNILKNYNNMDQTYTSHPLRVNSAGSIIGNNPIFGAGTFLYANFLMHQGMPGEYIVTQTSLGGPVPCLRILKVNNVGTVLIPAAVNYNIPNLYLPEWHPQTWHPRRIPITPLSDGSVVICWLEPSTNPGYTIKIQRLNPSLSPLWDAISINVSYEHVSLKILEAENLGIYTSWAEFDYVNYISNLRVNKFSSDGIALWGNEGFILNASGIFMGNEFQMVNSSQLGNVFAVWHEGRIYPDTGISCQVISQQGALLHPEGGVSVVNGAYTKFENGNVFDIGENFLFVYESKKQDKYLITDANLNPLTSGSPISHQPGVNYSYVNSAINDLNQVAVLLSTQNEYDYDFWLQVINPDGSLVLQEPLFLYVGLNTYPEEIELSSEGSDFYLVWKITIWEGRNYHQTIKGQRVSNGVLMWGTQGRIIHQDLLSRMSLSVAISGRYFLWYNDDNYFVKLLDLDGYPAAGWSDSGTSLFSEPNQYINAPVLHTGYIGSNLIIIASGDGGNTMLQKVSPLGECMWQPEGIELSGELRILDTVFGDDISCVFWGRDEINWINGKLKYIRLDANGDIVAGSVAEVATIMNFDRLEAKLINYPDGWQKIVWVDVPEGSGFTDLFSCNIAPSGSITPPTVLCNAYYPQRNIAATKGEAQNAISWTDSRRVYYHEEYQMNSVYASNIVSGSSGVEDENTPVASVIGGASNYPNPFNPSTIISFTLGQKGIVQVDIYNLKGQKVRSMGNNTALESGTHQVVWDGCNDEGKTMPSGVYLYNLQCGLSQASGKMLRLK